MKVEIGKLITLEYTITTLQGEMIESSVGRGEPITFEFGTDSGLPIGLVEGLEGMEVDDEKEFDIPPEKAFGTVDSGPTMPLPRNAFPGDTEIKVGGSFEGSLPNSDQTVKFIVMENSSDKVIVRLIHPLAGKTLHIQAKILDITDAPTADDLVEEDN